MAKDNGDTEIAFLAAFGMWLLTIALGYLTNYFYLSWLNNEPHEFSFRATKILNVFPSGVHFFLVSITLALFAYWSVQRTIKFIRLLRS
jgi:hypothetical protein